MFTGEDLLIAGLHFGCIFPVSTVLALAAGYYSVKTKTVRLPIFSFVLIVIFNICYAMVNPSTNNAALWGYDVLLGVGTGILLLSNMVVAQLSTPSEIQN